MEKFKLIIGVSALCLLFSFNLRHALNDYGVSDPNNQLHPQVYAQTNTAGSGGGSTPGEGGDTPGNGGGCTAGLEEILRERERECWAQRWNWNEALRVVNSGTVPVTPTVNGRVVVWGITVIDASFRQGVQTHLPWVAHGCQRSYGNCCNPCPMTSQITRINHPGAQ